MNPTLATFARRALTLAVPVAIGVAALVYVARREPDPTGTLLPTYGVSAGSLTGSASSAPPASSTLTLRGAPDEEFELLARPSRPMVAGKVVAFVFAMGEDEPNPVDARVEVTPSGEVRVRGRARALRSSRELRVVLGTAEDSISRYDDALAQARSGASDVKVRVLVVPVVRP